MSFPESFFRALRSTFLLFVSMATISMGNAIPHFKNISVEGS